MTTLFTILGLIAGYFLYPLHKRLSNYSTKRKFTKIYLNKKKQYKDFNSYKDWLSYMQTEKEDCENQIGASGECNCKKHKRNNDNEIKK